MIRNAVDAVDVQIISVGPVAMDLMDVIVVNI